MKRCWLHIGMHKTGTTSIQVNLAKAEPNPHWRYITLPGSKVNLNQSLYAMFDSEPHRSRWFAKRGLTAEQVQARGKKLRKKFGQALAAGDHEITIVSAEAASLIDPCRHQAVAEVPGETFR